MSHVDFLVDFIDFTKSFGLFATKLGCFQNLDHKNNLFPFPLVAKICCTQLYSTKYMFLFVCRRIEIQPYWTEKGIHPVCSELLLVSLRFERNNVFVGFRTLNSQFRYEKKGRGCSGKRITENSVTYPKINGNVVLSKIK